MKSNNAYPKGRPPKNPDKKFRKVSLSLPPEIEIVLRERSWSTGQSLSEIVAEVLRDHMAISASKDVEVQSLKVAEDPTLYRFTSKK